MWQDCVIWFRNFRRKEKLEKLKTWLHQRQKDRQEMKQKKERKGTRKNDSK